MRDETFWKNLAANYVYNFLKDIMIFFVVKFDRNISSRMSCVE